LAESYKTEFSNQKGSVNFGSWTVEFRDERKFRAQPEQQRLTKGARRGHTRKGGAINTDEINHKGAVSAGNSILGKKGC